MPSPLPQATRPPQPPRPAFQHQYLYYQPARPLGPQPAPRPAYRPLIDYAAKPRRRRFAWWKVMTLATVVVLLGVLGGIVTYLISVNGQLPPLRSAYQPALKLATLAYTADGQELARYYQENRKWVPYSQISPHVVQALVATEDHRFYNHAGIDLSRTFSSALKTLFGDRQGASTITMQLARNYYPEIGSAPPFERKVKEMLMARKIEEQYSKEKIIEMYLNTVPFGNNAFGIEAAAETYFNKRGTDLSLTESATLVAMLKGPTRYNPLRQPTLAKDRRNLVLRRMVEHDYLNQNTYASLYAEPIVLDFHTTSLASSPAPHFAEYVRTWLDAWARENGHDIYTDGLRVYTTLDTRLQALAEQAVVTQLEGLQAVVDYEWSQRWPRTLSREIGPYQRARASVQPFAYFWRANPHIVDEYIRQSDRYRRAVQRGDDPQYTLARLRTTPFFMDSLRADRTRLEAGLISIDPQNGHVKAWVGGRDFQTD